MKQNAMWKKLVGFIAIAMVITLAGTGTVFATETAPADESAVQIPAVLGDDLLSVEDEDAEGDEAAQSTDDADVSDKPTLGVTVANMNTSSYAVVKGILPVGAYITGVETDSLADVAGLLAGDIVVEVDETVVTAVSQMAKAMQEKEVGDTVTLKIFRVEGLESAQSYSDIAEGEYIDVSIELTIPEEVEQ